MLSKCANPVCSQTFLYLREGKLFRLAVAIDNGEATAGGNSAAGSTTRLRHEYFWLCESCARKFQVVSERDGRVRTIPLTDYQAAS